MAKSLSNKTYPDYGKVSYFLTYRQEHCQQSISRTKHPITIQTRNPAKSPSIRKPSLHNALRFGITIAYTFLGKSIIAHPIKKGE